MDLPVVFSSFALLFLAEMGDKTQLMVMTLASRHRLGPVVAGSFAAFAVLNLLAVALGAALLEHVPRALVLLAAGVVFLVFAWRFWREAMAGEGEEEEGLAAGAGRGALATSFTLVFVAELGDKTQVALVGLAAGTGAPWSVFTGGTLALWSVTLAGALVGAAVLRRVPRALVNRVAAVLFLVFGLLAVWQAVQARAPGMSLVAAGSP